MFDHVRAIRTVLYKNLLHLTRYKFDLMFWAILPILWVIPVILQGQAMAGGSTSTAFAQLAGTEDYLTFVIIGSVLFGFVMSALWGAGNAIRWEQQSGTLQSLWSAPQENHRYHKAGRRPRRRLVWLFSWPLPIAHHR